MAAFSHLKKKLFMSDISQVWLAYIPSIRAQLLLFNFYEHENQFIQFYLIFHTSYYFPIEGKHAFC